MSRRRLLLLLAGYVVFLAGVLFQPDASLANRVIAETREVLLAVGFPEDVATPLRVQFLLNALMFAPLSLLAALAWPRHPWATWVVYAFVGSAAVELTQGLLLPIRSAQYVDVVANTLGALIGPGAAVVLTRAEVLVNRPSTDEP